MSNVQQDPSWWLASDGLYYPPELALKNEGGNQDMVDSVPKMLQQVQQMVSQQNTQPSRKNGRPRQKTSPQHSSGVSDSYWDTADQDRFRLDNTTGYKELTKNSNSVGGVSKNAYNPIGDRTVVSTKIVRWAVGILVVVLYIAYRFF